MPSEDDRVAWLKRPRIVDFYDSLTGSIPCLPNTPEVREKLSSMSLSEVLIAYVNFADRFIAPRPRIVSWAPFFWDQPNALAQMNQIYEVIREIETGMDLSRRLSPRTLKVGFSPESANKWEDKDFALNAYDLHHLHLGRLDKHGVFKHADPLLFLTLSRTHAHIFTLGTHKSFSDRSLEKVVASERARAGFTLKGLRSSRAPECLDATHRMARVGFSTSTDVDDEVVPLAMLSSSGHRLRSVRFADQVLDVLNRIEVSVDAPDFVTNTFGASASRMAVAPEFVWRMQYLDLTLIDLKSMTAGVFLKGS